MARFLRTETNSSGGHSRLRPPAVITIPPPFVARPVQVNSAVDALRRNFRVVARIPKSKLPQVKVVGAGIAFHGPGVRLTDPRSSNTVRNARRPDSHLFPPAVVNPAATAVARPTQVTLSADLLRRQFRVVARIPDSRLRPPTAITPDTFTPCAFTTDTFNRADEDPIAGIWMLDPGQFGLNSARLISNLFAPSASGTGFAQLRQGVNTSAFFQAQVTIGGTRDGASQWNVGFKTAAGDYVVVLTLDDATGNWTLFIPGGTTWTTLRNFAVGDKIALTVTPGATSVYRVYHQPGGSGPWQAVATISDTANNWGSLGLIQPNLKVIGSARLDDFSFCPFTNDGVATMRATQSRGVPKSRLYPPAVVTPAATSVARPTQVTLSADLLRRQFRAVARRPGYELAGPTIVDGPGKVKGGIGTVFTQPPRQARGAKSRLLAPAVVTAVATEVFFGPEVKLAAPQKHGTPKSHLDAPSVIDLRPQVFKTSVNLSADLIRRQFRTTNRSPVYKLSPPAVVGAGIVFRPVQVELVRIRPVPVRSLLRKPTDLIDQQDVGRVRVTLAPQKRGTPESRLRPPVAIDLRPQVFYIKKTLVRIKHPPVEPRLFPPTVIDLTPQVFFIEKTLVRIKHPPVEHRLFPPTDTKGTEDQGKVNVKLTRIRPPRTIARVKPPTVIDLTPQVFRVDLKLAPSSRGIPKSVLRDPAVINLSPQVFKVRAKLAYSLRGTPKSHLDAPAVIDLTPQVFFIEKTLARIKHPPVAHRLFPPTVIDLTPQVFYFVRVELARIRPAPVHSALRKPADLIDQQDVGIVSVTLAPQKRGIPKSRINPPAVIDLRPQAFYVSLSLAPSSRGIPSSFIRAPVVVSAAGAFYGPQTTLAPQKLGTPKSRLFAPVVVAATTDVFFGPKADLAASKRGVAKSRFPQVVYDARIYKPIDGYLTPARDRNPQVNSRLSPPAVIDTRPQTFYLTTTLVRIVPPPVHSILRKPTDTVGLEDAGFVRTHLAYSVRGKPKSVLRPPTVIDTRPTTYYLATTLAYSLRGKPKSFLGEPTDLVDAGDLGLVRVHLAYSVRGKAKPRLVPPTVVAPVLANPIVVQLAPSFRGKSKPRLSLTAIVDLRPQTFFVSTTLVRIVPPAVHSVIRKPTDLVDLQDVGFVSVTLAPQKRGTPKSVLRKPVVIDVRPQTFYVAVTLAPSFRGKPKPIVGKPQDLVDAQDLGAVRVHLTYSLRGKPKSRLIPPTVVAPVLARPTFTKLVRIRPARTIARVEPPTAIDLTPQTYYISTTFVRIVPPPTITRLFPPTDLIDTQDLGSVAVTLAYSVRGKPKSLLGKPADLVDAADLGFVAATLVRIRPVRTRSRLTPPAVIDLAPQTYFIATTLVRIRPVPTQTVVRPPTDLSDAQDLGSVKTHLAYSVRGKPKSVLHPPVVIDLRPQAYYVTLTLAPSFRGKPKPVLGKPTDLVDAQDLGLIRVHLAYSLRGKAKSRLIPPAVVAPVLAIPIIAQLAPSFRGIPKSRLEPPTVVFPFFARPTDITLARIRPVPTLHVVRRPVDLVDRDDLGAVRAHLAYSVRGIPKSILRDPAVIDTSPQAFYLTTWLAYSSRGIPKSILRPDSKFALQPQARYTILVHLAYSSRGVPQSFIRAPVVVTAATPYLRPIDTTFATIRPARTLALLRRPTDTVGIEDQGSVSVALAYSRRGAPRSHLFPPAVIAPVLARPVGVTLARIRPPHTIAVIRQPAVVTPRVPQDAVADVTLAYQSRGKPKSRLFSPVVVQTFRIPYLNISLAPSSRGIPKSFLRKPVDLVDRDDLGYVRVHLAYARRGVPKSILRKPAVVAPVLARVIETTLVRIRPVHTLAILRQPAVVTPRVEDAVADITLAYSLRGKAKSRLSAPTAVFPFFPRALDATFAIIRPAAVRSTLGRPADLVDRADLGYTRVHLTYGLRGAPKSRLAAPTVVAPVLAPSLRTTLARIRPAHTISRLSPPIVSAAPADVIATAFTRIRPSDVYSVLRGAAVVGDGVYFRGLVVHLAPSSRGAPKSFLRPDSRFVPQAHAVTTVAVTLTYSLRGKPKSRLAYTPPFPFHEGVVCSAVLDLSEVCGDTTDLSGILQGAVLDEDAVSGEDIAESQVIGENLDMFHVDGEVL